MVKRQRKSLAEEFTEAKLIKTKEVEQDVVPVTEPVQADYFVEKTIQWKKIGGGSLYFGNKIIKQGQVFSAKKSELPKAFLSALIALEEIPVVQEQKLPANVKYSLKSKGFGRYDIVDTQEKVLNEKSLTKEEALTLLNSLQ